MSFDAMRKEVYHSNFEVDVAKFLAIWFSDFATKSIDIDLTFGDCKQLQSLRGNKVWLALLKSDTVRFEYA